MNPEAQLIALLEWMGWKWFGVDDRAGKRFYQFVQPGAFSASQIERYRAAEIAGSDIPEGAEILPLGLPPLTLDLMREAWLKLDDGQKFLHRTSIARVVGADFSSGKTEDCWVDEPTKEQRLEALLKTIGKWEPTHSPKIATEGMK